MSNQPNSKIQTLEVKAANGDVYTAIKDERDSPWEISFACGDDRFYGSVPEVKRHIAGLIKIHGADKDD